MLKDFDSIEEFTNNKDKKLSKKEKNTMIFQPKVAVLGIGGAGTNAINNLIKMDLTNIKFIIANTDIKSLDSSNCPNKIHLGLEITKGLGAGSNPSVGYEAAEKSKDNIIQALADIDLLFLIAGMGGGTGTGASPVIANIAKELNILTLGFVTKPFNFEGKQRMSFAIQGINELEKTIDSIIVMSNQNLFKVVNENTSMLEAFRITDGVIYSGIKAITDLITANGMVNLDFNDIKFILSNGGKAVVTSVEVTGDDKIAKITNSIMNNPLIDNNINIVNAKNILISIAGGLNMTLFEVDKIINSLRDKANKSTYVNFGAIFDSNMADNIRVSIIANGIISKIDNETIINETYNENNTSKASVVKSIMNEVLKEDAGKNDSQNSHEDFISKEAEYKPQNNYNKINYNNTMESCSDFNKISIEKTPFSQKDMDLSESNSINKKSSLFNLIEKQSKKTVDINVSPSSSVENFENIEANKTKVFTKGKDSKSFFELPPFLKHKK